MTQMITTANPKQAYVPNPTYAFIKDQFSYTVDESAGAAVAQLL
jgi:hypothetical protein